ADPTGELRTLESMPDAPQVLRLDTPGLYHLSSISGTSSENISREDRTLAVNTFFPQESATAAFPSIRTTGGAHSDAPADIPQETPLWKLLIGCAAVLLLIEFLLRAFASNLTPASPQPAEAS
ncbi:MAG: hypothetical protein KDD44_08975, partial [Bdellovibrionales bacterium]|nr:hypothetical protein [Bdellovibrionales bacterium]